MFFPGDEMNVPIPIHGLLEGGKQRIDVGPGVVSPTPQQDEKDYYQLNCRCFKLFSL